MTQVNKVDHILKNQNLQEGMTRWISDVDVGISSNAGCKNMIKGTGITPSKERKQKFSEDIEREGLKDRLQVELMVTGFEA